MLNLADNLYCRVLLTFNLLISSFGFILFNLGIFNLDASMPVLGFMATIGVFFIFKDKDNFAGSYFLPGDFETDFLESTF